MSTKYSLTVQDILEIISSTLLAEMNFQKRMDNLVNGTLANSFIPDMTSISNLEIVLKKIAHMFDVPQKQLSKINIRSMAENIFVLTKGCPRKITFYTSGSTGTPTPSSHFFSDLTQEISSLANEFKNRTRIVNFVPRHHIYGFLFSILLPKALEIPACHTHPMPTPDLVKNFRKGDLIISVPLLWKKLKNTKAKFTSDIYGVTSTAPCPPDVILALRTNGLSRMTEVYGSSETSGVGFRHSPTVNYTLFPYWKKEKENSLRRINSFENDEISYPLQDTLKWKDKYNFIPLRRVDKAIQVAGINVYPSKIESFFKTLPPVLDCAVRLMRPEEGDRLKIVIIPTPDIPQTDIDSGKIEREIRTIASSNLTIYERPRFYTFRTELPTSDVGKRTDW